MKKKDEPEDYSYVEQIPLVPEVHVYNDGVDENYIFRLRKRILKISENKEKNKQIKKKPKRLTSGTKGQSKSPV